MLLCTKVHQPLPCSSNCFPFRAPEHLSASVSLRHFDPDVSLMDKRKPGVVPSSLPAGQEERCRLVSSHRRGTHTAPRLHLLSPFNPLTQNLVVILQCCSLSKRDLWYICTWSPVSLRNNKNNNNKFKKSAFGVINSNLH